jgi:uncharacterized coiled-coil protein SlyX
MLISQVTVEEINSAIIDLQKKIEAIQNQLNNLLKQIGDTKK